MLLSEVKMIFSLLCYWFLVNQNIASNNLNEFDTYNADCKRVRRSWQTLTREEKQDYIDALMTIRENGNGDVLSDELVAIGSSHQNRFGEIEHVASSYLFWHGYLLWELESRIRNLGGKYKCFGMPYWDFSTEASRIPTELPYVFDDIVGGDGDPNNYYNVNEYSWKYTTKQYWVPAHCDADGDQYPLCSLKRSASNNAAHGYSASETGEGIKGNSKFADFTVWYSDTFNLPHELLTDVEYLCEPVITSYDPIWYLFHSMVSYHQAIWTDCNDYDLIAAEDLDKYPEAYNAFCYNGGAACGPMQLDDKMVFGGYLPGKEWSFIHNNDLTVRKSYHFPRWNIIYDLGNGEGFYTQSGLNEFCKGKLNSDWFMLNEDENKILDEYTPIQGVNAYLNDNQLLIVGIVVMIIGLVVWCMININKKQYKIYNTNNYGSV
eukprot:513448_1